jgi:hypothetical protein
MAKLITNAKDIATAETADLVFTYNELEGKSIKKFESRSTAERRTEMAILAAKDRAGHRGVKVGEQPKAEDGKVNAKDKPKAATKAVETPKAPKADKPTAKVDKTPKAPKAAKEPKAPKEPKAAVGYIAKEDRTPNGPRGVKGCKTITATALGKGETGIRGDSFRGQILESIINNPGISKDELVAEHGAYTADVVCKFKRLGYITETFTAPAAE